MTREQEVYDRITKYVRLVIPQNLDIIIDRQVEPSGVFCIRISEAKPEPYKCLDCRFYEGTMIRLWEIEENSELSKDRKIELWVHVLRRYLQEIELYFKNETWKTIN
jgi:hypothetical protein